MPLGRITLKQCKTMDRNEFIARYMIALADSDNHFETDAEIAISAADELEERIPNIFTK